MFKMVFATGLLAIVIGYAIVASNYLNKQQKIQVVKSIGFAIMCLLLAVAALSFIVAIF